MVFMRYNKQYILAAFLMICATFLLSNATASALSPIPNPDPKPGSYGLEATKKQAPPTKGATITTPGSGASFSSSPTTVSGICPKDLLVQIYNNGVMVGSVMCKNGSFSLEISLFAGVNELSAIVYDDLGQAGPTSKIVKVTYKDTKLSAFGKSITLTSSYGRRSADTGRNLTWPLQLSGGTGPYAFSIDWGDGSAAQLKSQSLAGLVNIAHVYQKAGIYLVNVKVTDTNDVSAFLQITAVSNGKVEEDTKTESDSQQAKKEVLWVPTAVAAAFLFPSFWLGRRSQVVSLRHKMLKERDAAKE